MEITIFWCFGSAIYGYFPNGLPRVQTGHGSKWVNPARESCKYRDVTIPGNFLIFFFKWTKKHNKNHKMIFFLIYNLCEHGAVKRRSVENFTIWLKKSET